MPKTVELKEETFDHDKNEFVYKKIGEFVIEHSLVSISKWEQKYHKPFLSTDKTAEETLDYIIMMIIEPKDFDIELLNKLSDENLKEIHAYIDDPMTATKFPEDEIEKIIGKKKKPNKKKETLTNELIYYWMSAANIPFECENWHINRLLTLIRVYDTKNQPEKKMSKSEIASRNRALNEARRKKMKSKG